MESDPGSISDVVEELTTFHQWTKERLAFELDVSISSVTRWHKGTSRPAAPTEGSLRSLYQRVREERAHYSTTQMSIDLGDSAGVRAAIDRCLAQLREAFHRHASLSGRREALDEVSKLLFAHVTSLANDARGIDTKLLDGDRTATRLAEFVASAFSRFLPESIAHDFSPESFNLRLKANEIKLATEIVYCFDTLSAEPGLVSAHGIECVDILNEVFGKFLADSFVDEKQLGQYLTPTEVVRFMVQLALGALDSDDLRNLQGPDPKKFGLVLDPSCGVASFLAEFVRSLHGMTTQADKGEDRWLDRVLREVVVGIDKSEQMIRLAHTNIAMFGIPAVNIHLANSISLSSNMAQKLRGQVGLILTNPPFGAEFAKSDVSSRLATEQFFRGRIPSECLFIERYVDWLRPGGHLLAIVPDSVLTNQGVFSVLRKTIAREVDILSVISLPSETFAASGTTTKTSILHFVKRKSRTPNRSQKTFVAQANDIGYTVSVRNSHRTKKTTGPGDLPKILVSRRDSSSKDLVKCVPQLSSAERWDAPFHLFNLKPAKSALRVADVAALANRRHDPRRNGRSFKYIEISDVDSITLNCRHKEIMPFDAPSRARKLVEEGDVLISTVRPERKTIGVVPKGLHGATCTTGFAVLKPISIDSYVLAKLLQADYCTNQMMRHNIGIAYPAIDERCLLEVALPVAREDVGRLASSAKDMTRVQERFENFRNAFAKQIEECMASFRTGSKHH